MWRKQSTLIYNIISRYFLVLVLLLITLVVFLLYMIGFTQF